MTALITAFQTNPEKAQLLVCTDHEEIGSQSACGAQGPFLKDTLERLLPDNEKRLQAIRKSLLISADNAHAVHPNYADRHDENHGPKINAGPVIKINANQRYATNSENSAVFRQICDQESIPVQEFVVRSDMGCGSTIGPITASTIGVSTVDVGCPQWAMHSIRETAGSQDISFITQAMTAFYQRPIATIK
jgi:aspartyl aminopeptidase